MDQSDGGDRAAPRPGAEPGPAGGAFGRRRAEIAAITRAATTRPDADYGEADLAFHRAVATAARNRLAADFYALLRRVARDNRLSLQRRGPDCITTRLRQRDAEHQAIAEAIAARDPDASDAAMRRHLTAVQRAITDRLAPGAGD